MMINSAKTQITVGGQVFYIPSERLQEVYSLLSRLQGIAVAENITMSPQTATFTGQTLIRG